MTKRFGRNQKRKMRLEIERLERNLNKEKDSHSQSLLDIQKVRCFLSNIDNTLKTEVINSKPDGLKRYSTYANRKCSDYDPIVNIERIDPITLKRYNDKLAGCMRYEFFYGSKSCGYSMTNDYLQCVPEHVLINEIGMQCGKMIAEDMKDDSN